MTQEDVLAWVEAHGCEITHSKRNFHRVVNASGDAVGVPVPRDGEKFLLPMTVCRICYNLGVPIPDYAKEAFEAYAKIQKDNHDRDL